MPHRGALIALNGAAFALGRLFFLNPVTPAMTAVGGEVKGLACLRSRSLAKALFLHAAAGLLAFTMGLGRFRDHGAAGRGADGPRRGAAGLIAVKRPAGESVTVSQPQEENDMPAHARKAEAPRAAPAVRGEQPMQAVAESALSMQSHLMAFATLRLQREMEAVSALAQCRTPPEAVEAARRFWAQTVEDYAEQARTMAGLAFPAIQDAADGALRSAALPE